MLMAKPTLLSSKRMVTYSVTPTSFEPKFISKGILNSWSSLSLPSLPLPPPESIFVLLSFALLLSLFSFRYEESGTVLKAATVTLSGLTAYSVLSAAAAMVPVSAFWIWLTMATVLVPTRDAR